MMPTNLLVYGWALFSGTKERVRGVSYQFLQAFFFLVVPSPQEGALREDASGFLKSSASNSASESTRSWEDKGVAYWESPSEKYKNKKIHKSINHSPHHHHPCHWLTGSTPWQHWGQVQVCLLKQKSIKFFCCWILPLFLPNFVVSNCCSSYYLVSSLQLSYGLGRDEGWKSCVLRYTTQPSRTAS